MSFDLKLENGDLILDTKGSLDLVFNDDKIKQDIIKVVLTPLGDNQLFPWYGSPLLERAIGHVLDKRIIDMEIKNSIIYCINNLMTLQKDQEKSGQYVSPAEAISQIVDIKIQVSPFDARQVDLIIKISSRKANVIEESFKLRT